MSTDTKPAAANPQAKMQTLFGVLLSMGPMAAYSLPRPGFRGVRLKTHGKRHHRGSGEGFDVPDPEEAMRICDELDRQRREKWMQEHLTTHAERMKAIRAQDIAKSRQLLVQRRKAARAAKRLAASTTTITTQG